MRRDRRLRHPQDFVRVRSKGQSLQHRLLFMNFLPNGRQTNRYGFVTSKRLGNAVTRNRARRLLRESVHQLYPRIRPGYDIVFVARPGIVGQDYWTISEAVEKLVKQAELLTQYQAEADQDMETDESS